MILCDSQAVEVLAVTIMKTLQQCYISDLLPRVGALISFTLVN